jgi:hypothetical protein
MTSISLVHTLLCLGAAVVLGGSDWLVRTNTLVALGAASFVVSRSWSPVTPVLRASRRRSTTALLRR